jgi:hypothetical protein
MFTVMMTVCMAQGWVPCQTFEVQKNFGSGIMTISEPEGCEQIRQELTSNLNKSWIVHEFKCRSVYPL